MKTKVLLIITACMILLSGCARMNEEGKIDEGTVQNPGSVAENKSEETEKMESPTVETSPSEKGNTAETESVEPVPSSIPDDMAVFSDLSSLKSSFTVGDYVVFIGKKTSSLEHLDYSFPVVLAVEEPYYGEIKTGQTIIMREILGTIYDDDVIMPVISGDLEQIEDDVEYIFILRKTVDPKTDEEYYTYVSRNHTFSRVSERADLAKKVQNGTATKLEQFRSSVLETYLNNPDTRLDLHAEASKLFCGIPEDATEDEILNALPAEQKALFEDLIEQYGTK